MPPARRLDAARCGSTCRSSRDRERCKGCRQGGRCRSLCRRRGHRNRGRRGRPLSCHGSRVRLDTTGPEGALMSGRGSTPAAIPPASGWPEWLGASARAHHCPRRRHLRGLGAGAPDRAIENRRRRWATVRDRPPASPVQSWRGALSAAQGGGAETSLVLNRGGEGGIRTHGAQGPAVFKTRPKGPNPSDSTLIRARRG
jgi:hypothetical protein